MNEATFSVLDQSANGMIDSIELFTMLAFFADGKIDDKVRFLFDLYDFNQNGYLEETELHFLALNTISGAIKVFQIDTELPNFPGSSGE